VLLYEKGNLDTEREDGHGMTEAEVKSVLSQTKAHLGPPEAERG